MLSTTSVLFLLSFLAPVYVQGANDWSVPCISGSCTWDTGDGKTTAYSSMAIGGTDNLISDITPAAGWNIQGCDPNWGSGSHTVQMTCTGSSAQTAHCGHVYQGGAENTIVRLPENCGKGPFARVVSATNKTEASSIAKRIAKSQSNSTITGVHSLTLDYNFSKIPTSRGKVTFAVTSTNLPGQPGVSRRELNSLRGRGRAGDLHRRRFASINRKSVGSFVGNTASAITSAAGSAASSIGSAVSSANTIDKTFNSGKLTPINFDQDVTLFDQSISCDSGDISGSASLKIDVDGKVDATVSFGVTVVGTIVPPEISDFSVTANLGGSTSATFNVDATAEGSFDTGKVSLFKSGLPGLSIPSVITLGPEFSIDGQVTIEIEAEAKLAIEAAWDFPSIQLVFPQDKGGSTGDATVSGTDNPLQLSADPSLDISGTVTAHIIPRIDFGIDLFDGSDSASVFIDADISASLKMEVTAEGKIDNSDNSTSTADATNSTSTAQTASATDSTANSTSTALDATQTNNSTLDDANDGLNSTSDGLDGDGFNSTTDGLDSDGFNSTTDGIAGDDGFNSTTDGFTGDDGFNSTTDDFTGDDGFNSTTDGLPTDDTDSASNSTSTDLTDSDLNSDNPTNGTAVDTGDDSDASTADDGSGATSTDTADAPDPSDDTSDTTDSGDGDSTTTNDGTDGGDQDASDPTLDDTTDDGADSADDGTDSSDDGTDPADDGTDPTDDGTDDNTDDSADGGAADDTDDSLDDGSSADDSSDVDASADDGSDASDDGTDDSADDSTDIDDGGDDSDSDADVDDSGDDSDVDDGRDDGSDDGSDDDSDDEFAKRSLLPLRRRDESGSLNGCITVTGAIDISGGLQGSLAPFVSESETTFPIFNKDVQLFQRCLNGPPDGAAERKRKRSNLIRREGDSSGLQCPTKGVVTALTSII